MTKPDEVPSVEKSFIDRTRDRVKSALAPRSSTLIKQMVAEQEHWNDLFSTKLIETLNRTASLEEQNQRLQRDFARKQRWLLACCLVALLLALSALVLSLRGLR